MIFLFCRPTKTAETPVSTEKEESKKYPKKKREHNLNSWKDYDQPEAVKVPMDQRENTGPPKMPPMFKSNFLEPRESNLHVEVKKYFKIIIKMNSQLSHSMHTKKLRQIREKIIWRVKTDL